jgi:hypothetical protein
LDNDGAPLGSPRAREARCEGRHMGLFGLFGGKKKDEAKPVAATPASVAAKAVEPAKVAAPMKGAAASAPVTAAPVGMAAVGAEQVRLRLKLVAAVKTGKTAAAYQAAKGLADIQAKAGRRLGARMWAQQADRILELDPEAA